MKKLLFVLLVPVLVLGLMGCSSPVTALIDGELSTPAFLQGAFGATGGDKFVVGSVTEMDQMIITASQITFIKGGGNLTFATEYEGNIGYDMTKCSLVMPRLQPTATVGSAFDGHSSKFPGTEGWQNSTSKLILYRGDDGKLVGEIEFYFDDATPTDDGFDLGTDYVYSRSALVAGNVCTGCGRTVASTDSNIPALATEGRFIAPIGTLNIKSVKLEPEFSYMTYMLPVPMDMSKATSSRGGSPFKRLAVSTS